MNKLFKKTVKRDIGECSLHVSVLTLSQFDDALDVGRWLQEAGHLESGENIIDALAELRSGAPLRNALERLIAGSLSTDEAGIDTLSIDVVKGMPIIAFVEAFTVLLEENLDFFFRALPRLVQAKQKILTGGALLSNSSAPATAATGSAATP